MSKNAGDYPLRYDSGAYQSTPKFHLILLQKMPYLKELPHGLRDGHVLVIDTFIKPLSKRFVFLKPSINSIISL